MDPVTHAAAARLAASIGRPSLSRSGAVLSVIAGLAPDLDAVMMPAGWDLYLRVHEAGTHSLPGGVLLAGALAAITRRWSTEPFQRLFAIAVTGIGVHVFLDVISGATIKLAWPMFHSRTAAGLVAMADPLLAVPFTLGLAAVLVGRWQVRTIASVTFALAGLVLAGKFASQALALAAFGSHADPLAIARHVHAEWGSLTGWWVYETTERRVRLWHVDGWEGSAVRTLDWERAGAADMLRGEADLATVQNFLRAHELPVRVVHSVEGAATVFWSDLRFCYPPDPRAGPRPGDRLRPTGAALACGVWFGGTIDPEGRIRRQFVTIGGYLQER